MEQILADIAQLGTSPDDHYRVWYEIFVYSFCDSNGDGFGDLQGIISKLDYLKDLGIGGIWLMPIHPSTTYHKYNVTNYYMIAPEYGTMEDFEALIAACAERDIKVILDLVVNHTGSAHEWFRTAYSYLQSLPEGQEPKVEDCPYLNYYHFNTTGGTGYRAITGTPYYYECQFAAEMPDLNLDEPALRAEIEKIMKFWMDKGVAGFRLDAAKEFFTGNSDKNIEVLSWLQSAAKAIDPDAYMVAEVWSDFTQITDYYASGITSIFNYPFGDSMGKISKVVNNAGASAMVNSYATALEKADKSYLAKNLDYIDAPFLSNHDVGRIGDFTSGKQERMKLAGAMNLMMSGAAFVYYGEEIGMVSGGSNDPSKRAPMLWNGEGNDGVTKRPPECSLPMEYPSGSLEEQMDDGYSVYNYYRQAIAIRNALPVISHGRTTAEAALNKGCISAIRKTWNDDNCLILMNIDKEAAQVDLSAYSDWELAASLSVDSSKANLQGSTLELPAYGVAILLPKA